MQHDRDLETRSELRPVRVAEDRAPAGGIVMIAKDYQEKMTEAQMETAVRELVDLRGGQLFHVRRSDAAPELAGLPDWLIIDPMGGRVMLIEAKSQKRLITLRQASVLAMLDDCHRFESGVVRPRPRTADEIAYDSFLEWLKP